MKKSHLSIDKFLQSQLTVLQKLGILGGTAVVPSPSTPSTGPHTLGGGEQNETTTPPIEDEEDWNTGGFGNETP